MSCEAQSERVAAFAGDGQNMHSLEVLGDLAGIHATQANSVLVGEYLSENYND
jgi:hypothetical protein